MHAPLLSETTQNQPTHEAEQLAKMIARELNALIDADERLAGAARKGEQILAGTSGGIDWGGNRPLEAGGVFARTDPANARRT